MPPTQSGSHPCSPPFWLHTLCIPSPEGDTPKDMSPPKAHRQGWPILQKAQGCPSLHTQPLHTQGSSLSVLSRRHERSAARVVSGVHLGLMLQQHPEPRDVVREGSGVKRGPAEQGPGHCETGKAIPPEQREVAREAIQASPYAFCHSLTVLWHLGCSQSWHPELPAASLWCCPGY